MMIFNGSSFFFFRETTKRFVNELKAQLAADITKRMCETLAFYLYDEWWQDQEVKYKERVRNVHTLKMTRFSEINSNPSSTLCVVPKQ